jgi:hypothetical protein
VEIRRNTNDQRSCFPGEVTAQNIADKLQKHRNLVVSQGEVEPPRHWAF